MDIRIAQVTPPPTSTAPARNVTVLGYTAEGALVTKLPNVMARFTHATAPGPLVEKSHKIAGLQVHEQDLGVPAQLEFELPVTCVNDVMLLLHRRLGLRDTDVGPLTSRNYTTMKAAGVHVGEVFAPLALAIPSVSEPQKVYLVHFHNVRCTIKAAQVEKNTVSLLQIGTELQLDPFAPFQKGPGYAGFARISNMREIEDMAVVLP